jgi:mono/diheme cytochrome c family protein
VGREEHLLSNLPGHLMVDTIASVLKATIQNKELGEVQLRPLPVKLVMDGRTRGATLYSAHCATCHGLDAKGIDQLAPPLENSEFVSSSAERFILIALNGLQGPVTVAGKEYNLNLVMPGIKNNPELSDDDIAVLLKFIGNGFNTGMPGINAQMVKDLREKTEDRDDLFTVESLEDWMQENLDIKVERIDNDKVREVR